MRTLTLGRIGAHPDWFSEITVRPEDFFSTPLLSILGGGILLGVLGHFEFATATIGQLRYKAIAEAWPIGGETTVRMLSHRP